MVKENKMLDILKFIAAIMILGSHCVPIFHNQFFNVYYGQWFFRFCVPLFFISSGYYFNSFSDEQKKTYIKRIFRLYLFATVIYLPFIFKVSGTLYGFFKNIVFGYYHLWYLSALLFALCILYFLQKNRKVFAKSYIIIMVVLWMLGVFFDEYGKFFDFQAIDVIRKGIGFIGGARHFMFFGLPMILVGVFISEQHDLFKISKTMCIVLTVFSFALSLVETNFLIKFMGDRVTCDITIFNAFPAIMLFIWSFKEYKCLGKINSTKIYRKMADIVYIIHIWIIGAVNTVFGFKYQLRVIAVILLSVSLSYIYVRYMPMVRKKFLKEEK